MKKQEYDLYSRSFCHRVHLAHSTHKSYFLEIYSRNFRVECLRYFEMIMMQLHNSTVCDFLINILKYFFN